MGVQGFMNILNNYFDSAVLRNFHLRKGDLIVVDADNVRHAMMERCGIGRIWGGRPRALRAAVRQFLKNFKYYGIEVIFIFDGKVPDEKVRIWSTRQKQKHQFMQKFFNKGGKDKRMQVRII